MKILLSSIQWTLFILAGSVIAPLAIGAAFHLSQAEIAEMLSRTLIVLGLGAVLQVTWGHRLPIAEGPAGLWWGVFLIFAGLVPDNGEGKYRVLQSLEMGLIISGFLFILLSGLHIIHRIKRVFTPLVIGTYLILLSAQMSGSFIKGMLGIGYRKPGIDLPIAAISALTLIISILLSRSRQKTLRSYSVLIAIGIGWSLFALFRLTLPIAGLSQPLVTFPQLLAWGSPQFDVGIVITSIMTTMLLLTNLITSIDVVGKVVQSEQKPKYNPAAFIMGLNQMSAALFSTVGFIPISYTAGFILTTKMKERMPFLLGSAIILAMGFVPSITLFFASLPIPVGYATIFLSFMNMIGIGMKEYELVTEKEKLFIIGISMMLGLGSMFIPTQALSTLPHWMMPIVSNGLIVGVLTCMTVEQGFKWKRTYDDKHGKAVQPDE